LPAISVYGSGAVNPDDSQLIALSVRGDRAAFGVLVGRYQDRLYHTAFRLIGNAEDARDVVQDSFLNAYQSLHQFKGDSRFFTWLYRIAVNAAISVKRKHRTLLSVDMPGGMTLSERPDESDGHQPGASLERAEDERMLQAALDALTPEHRAVLVLKEIEGQKYEIIAEVLGVPIGTVRSRLHRARLELRDRLHDSEQT
jgi:RNA polymerase sigma-70 factor (ECF subfamily)